MVIDGTRLFLLAVMLLVSVVWIVTNTYTLMERIWLVLHPKRAFAFCLPTVIFLSQIAIPPVLPWPSTVFSGLLSTIGFLLYVGGAAFAVWAKLTMGTNWGMPAQHNLRKQDTLVTSGPFAFSRNPIYVGLLSMLVGYELVLGSWLVFLVLPIFFMIRLAVSEEEKLLEHHFAQSYRDYRSRTARFL